MTFRVTDTVSGANFKLNLDSLPQIGTNIRLNDLVAITVVEFTAPNSLIVTSNATYSEILRAING